MLEQEKYKWFIARIVFRNESNVKSLLDIAGVEYYMPFKTVNRKWKDRICEFQVPAMPSCVFVRVAHSDFIMLQMMKEISLILDNGNNPLSLDDERMNAIRQQLDMSDNPGTIVLELINELNNK